MLRLSIVVLLVMLLGIPSAAGAQAPAGDAARTPRRHLMQRDPLVSPEQAEQSMPGLEETLGAFALPEGPIDAARYVMGPNDRLQLAIWGAAEMYRELLVSPEGKLFIPSVGVVDVGGLTLEAARAEIREAVLGVYSNVRVDVVLSALRRFKVHVVGAVVTPGAYTATAVTRASEVIDQAGGVLDVAALRGGQLRRRTGESLPIDLAAYQLTGSNERNPLVSDGAIIEVPRRTTHVLLSGAVANPGAYEPLPGEHLSDMLGALGGLTPSVDSSRVTLTTFVDASRSETREFAYVPGTPSGDPVLDDGDAVFFRVREDWHRFGQAFVYGAVRRPGRYAIPVDGIRLSALIPMAGGFTPRANLAQGHLLRPREGYTPIPVEPDVPISTLNETAIDQWMMEGVADTSLVRADFVRLFVDGDADADVVVRDRDIVHVPEDRADVRVMGLVRSPGAYPFASGTSVNDYVDLAGGYDRDADKGRTRLAPFYGAPLRQVDKGAPVTSGAIIYVPEKEHVSILSRTRDITAIFVQVASLVLVVDRLAE